METNQVRELSIGSIQMKFIVGNGQEDFLMVMENTWVMIFMKVAFPMASSMEMVKNSLKMETSILDNTSMEWLMDMANIIGEMVQFTKEISNMEFGTAMEYGQTETI